MSSSLLEQQQFATDARGHLVKPFVITGAGEETPFQVAPAAVGSLPRFQMLAYTGGKLHVRELAYPVVVDLTGCQVKPKRPVLHLHKQEVILGHTETVTNDLRTIAAAGVFSGTDPCVGHVVEMARREFPWQASIQAQVLRVEWLNEYAQTVVNGQAISGPCYIARQSLLRELTVAPIGVDDETALTIEASMQTKPKEAVRMDPTTIQPGSVGPSGQPFTITAATLPGQQQPSPVQKVPPDPQPATAPTVPVVSPAATPVPTLPTPPGPDSVQAAGPMAWMPQHREAAAAESDRINNIRTICARYDRPMVQVGDHQQPLEGYAIRAGWTAETTELHLLRHSRPTAPAIHSRSSEPPELSVLTAAYTLAGIGRLDESQTVKELGEQSVNKAADLYGHKGLGLQQLLLTCAALGGWAGSMFRISGGDVPGIIKAAFSTNALQSVLSNVANRFILGGFQSMPLAWKKIAHVRPVSDFRSVESFRLNSDLTFELVPPTGQIPSGKVGDDKFTNKAAHYGKMITIDFPTIVNGDPVAMQEMAFALGRGAHRGLAKIFWAKFLTGGFFTSGRGNYISGAGTVLSIAGMDEAVNALARLKEADGEPSDAVGKYLLVPSQLEATANSLYTSANIASGDAKPADNPHRNKYEPVSTPRLTNATAWYLLRDPNDAATVEVCFLDGQEEPVINEAEPVPGNSGLILSGMFNFGVAQQDPLGGVQSKGAA